PLCVKWLLESPKKYDGILAIGTVIRGETTHYDFLCQFLERALWDLQKEYSLPVIFSILTVENKEQALKRVFKGRDHAKALIEMIRFKGQC
ncbi:MAG: 6,7-dimethyl-8-ribityllumazine synthase, partial [Bdellovibrionales bacterium]